MALTVTPAIPASRIVNVIPSVLPAGGSALDLIGMMLTDNDRLPIGDVLQFETSDDVDDYFGSMTVESAWGSIYFLGYDNSFAKPGRFLATRYNRDDAAAWLRSGRVAGYTLAELQAIGGPLSITVDGVAQSGTVDLTSATSFSVAAEIIGADLGIKGTLDASVTGSINDGSASVTGSITGSVLTVTAVGSGVLYPDSELSGTGGGGIAAGTQIVAQLTGTLGGTGTYSVSIAQNVTSTTIAATHDPVLTVTAQASGSISLGDLLEGSGIAAGTYVRTFMSGTGGTGTYTVSESQIVGSVNILAYRPGVSYDSIFGSFVVWSGTAGALSTIDYAAAGTVASDLNLTAATGAQLSQGAVAATPDAFMDHIIEITQNWISFSTTFEPSESEKIDFATWTNSKQNRYLYSMWDTSAVNKGPSGPSEAAGTIVAGNFSGIAMIYDDPDIDTVGGSLGAFLMGQIASIDFNRTNGRATSAFRRQAGLLPQIFNGTEQGYLEGYGLNSYGSYTTANDAFTWFYPGNISGDFLWIDSYVDQVWLNNALQLAMMVLLDNVGSIPYNTAGYALVEASCLDPIEAAINAGVIRLGVTLSASQKAEVNAAAGKDVAGTLQSRGWYLLIQDAAPIVRQARGTPPMTLWYMDGQSIQKLSLASIEVQ